MRQAICSKGKVCSKDFFDPSSEHFVKNLIRGAWTVATVETCKQTMVLHVDKVARLVCSFRRRPCRNYGAGDGQHSEDAFQNRAGTHATNIRSSAARGPKIAANYRPPFPK